MRGEDVAGVPVHHVPKSASPSGSELWFKPRLVPEAWHQPYVTRHPRSGRKDMSTPVWRYSIKRGEASFYADVHAIDDQWGEPGQWLTQADYDKVAAVVAAAREVRGTTSPVPLFKMYAALERLDAGTER